MINHDFNNRRLIAINRLSTFVLDYIVDRRLIAILYSRFITLPAATTPTATTPAMPIVLIESEEVAEASSRKKQKTVAGAIKNYYSDGNVSKIFENICNIQKF